MEILNVEATPNPSTMKFVYSLEGGDTKPNTYTKIKEGQPHFINAVLEVEGVKSIFQAMDFISVDKKADVEWDDVLPNILATLERI
ncbi:NifU N-terminal domain-containing protein [Staphylococcus sp. NAM3COL9]|uniref:NifU N-terminal domain-containing protein n=1 Tax=Staphylococcus sp. NAM3COL9 TaxID=1667172 RepID=UPI00070F09E1|nr:NifU N-terminal domain-containing protein [Staphylococcus sp. NAM3COL9]KRG10176.1 scaffolding protein [Staphylococcus sp. NAM3COL9]